MYTIFMIDGGAGRAITAIPALLKYMKNNPQDDFKIFVYGWDPLYWGIPELQDRTFNPETKGMFENYFLNASRVITPEPYKLPAYYKQEKNLIQAFDAIINNTDDHKDLENIKLCLTKTEELTCVSLLSELDKKKPNVIFQPFGSTAKKLGNYVLDDSSRSLDVETYIKIVKRLSNKYNLIYFGEQSVSPDEDTYTRKYTGDLRFWMTMVDMSDYFIGVDSVGQHMASAFNKPGTIILGSTFAANISYPDHFNILKKDGEPKYSPLRISMTEASLADRINDTRMSFTDKEINQFLESIDNHIRKNVRR
jgi:hypothetical protein